MKAWKDTFAKLARQTDPEESTAFWLKMLDKKYVVSLLSGTHRSHAALELVLTHPELNWER